MPAMIEFHDVSRSYGKKLAVDRLTLRIDSGQLFAFLGPNGAGKTTTIKMMVGLLRPGSGTLRIGGYDVVEHPRSANHLIAYVPDEPYLYDKLTGREFMQFIADMYRMPRRDGERNIDREIENFELAGFVDELCENYSHGMKQRVVFASAMLRDPKVLVVDEPMVGLDPKSIRFVKDMLRTQAHNGVTVFMSTHTLSVAEEISDRIGIIHSGRIRFDGTVAELRQAMVRHEDTLEKLFLDLTAGPQET